MPTESTTSKSELSLPSDWGQSLRQIAKHVDWKRYTKTVGTSPHAAAFEHHD
jgi:hypothetical protein